MAESEERSPVKVAGYRRDDNCIWYAVVAPQDPDAVLVRRGYTHSAENVWYAEFAARKNG